MPDKIEQEALDSFPELHPAVVQLLFNRNLRTQKEIDEFLYPDYSQDVHDPFLFKDMAKVCERIYQAAENKELIIIYGDYDADGVTSATILATILEKIGAKFQTYIPHREREGYGLNQEAVKEFANLGAKLIITCDCGISDFKEISLANELGLQVIVTDHHTVPEQIPPAVGIIHPKVDESYPFKFLTGGGVAFKLVQGLLRCPQSKLTLEEREKIEKWLLDLVAISTVADIQPLLGENRTLLKYGLIVLQKTKRLGLRKLIEVAGVDRNKIDTQTIGYQLSPRINAAGRMDHANLAYYLLNENDETKAGEFAKDLNQSNIDRQKLTEQVVSRAQQQPLNLQDKLLIFYQGDWPAGLTGLAAGRLVRVYNRPCIVATDNGDNIIGSGRSVEGFNITEGLKLNESLLVKFGGHPQAAGFTLAKDNFPKLKEALISLANDKLAEANLEPKLKIELVIDFTDINWELADILAKFEPFGEANAEPLFMSEDVLVTNARRVGKDNNHWKLELVKKDKKLGAIAFGQGNLQLDIGHRVDIVYNVNINQWNGNREIQLIIRDLKLRQ